MQKEKKEGKPKAKGMKSFISKFKRMPAQRKRTKSLSPRRGKSRNINLDFHEKLNEAKLSDFVLIDELASGFLGHVYLAKCDKNGCYYVLKQMKKRQVVKARQVERVFNEKKIHQILCNESVHQVVKLFKTYSDKQNIYLLMEYMPADLFSILNIVNKNRVTLAQAQFCVANVVLSLQEIHSLGIIYRDLKPQNLLLDWDGYPVLTDFGFSKIVNLNKCKQKQLENKKKGKKKDNNNNSKVNDLSSLPPMTASFVGTPAYLAPEVLKREYYAEAVDCWALGVLTYEMLLGDVPFDDTELTSEQMIEHMRKGVEFPDDFPKDAKNFITGLLNSKPGERFNLEQVKKHEFFKYINWDALKRKVVVSPYKKFIPKKKAPNQEPSTKNFSIYKLYDDNSSNSSELVDSGGVSETVLEQLFSGF